MNAPDLPVAVRSALTGYRLSDAVCASAGRVFVTGTQALVRLPLMQRALDVERGLDTAGFVSGYRGSPLGAYDQQLWKYGERLGEVRIRFLAAVNEELAATAVLGSQEVESDPDRTVQGVFGLWYGKGPGVDRAGDALKHGNARGSSPHGGVLVVAGDDHGCVSSAFSHQSDFAMMSWRMPVLSPASVAELIEFGLYGWALSRASGTWVGMKAISEVVESAASVDLDSIVAGVAEPVPEDFFIGDRSLGSLHLRPDDIPSPSIEARMAMRLDAVRAFARIRSIDRVVADPPRARVGIVTCGKAHRDLLEALRRVELTLDDLARAGVRVYKIGLAYPIEPTRALAFAEGLEEVLVVEEKGPVVEQQLQALLYNAPSRPLILGKRDAHGAPLLSETAELRPSRLLPVLAAWLARHAPSLDRSVRIDEFVRPPLPSNAADSVRRIPFFCSGCPHNTSTRVPEGSRAQSGIGCHGMAMWMDRSTSGLLQMGGEGANWVAHGAFTNTPHVFQNLGDGTYFHSGSLAIRQAVAARANVTYKILHNDAVAMTGGQHPDGTVNAASIARQVRAEGVERIALVSDDPQPHRRNAAAFPPGTTFHHRLELDLVQRELRDTPGVTALVYDQACAAEKRRRRKRNEYPDPPRRLYINEAVCEGCGDCNEKSNCLSVVPVDTPDGRKRRIDQNSCNKDYRCADGFCPSFVSVEGGQPRRRSSALDRARFDALVARLPEAAPRDWRGPCDLLVTGVGGTGVVTVGAVIAMAAHLEGRHASVLDFMGFAQKGGSVLSHVRLATQADALNQVRIDTQQADAVLACDPVVAAGDDALQSVSHGRTRIVVNRHVLPMAMQVTRPDATVPVDALLAKLAAAAGDDRVAVFDAQMLSRRAIGDTMGANIVLLGYAWQSGLVPVSSAAIERAIELNGVAIEANRLAFRLGRAAAHDAAALEALLAANQAPNTAAEESLGELTARLEARLRDYQDERLAARLRRLVVRVEAAERSLRGAGEKLELTELVARNFAKLLAYKDEYEVARLYSSEAFRRSLDEQFEGEYSLSVQLAPPLLARRGPDGLPRKMRFGPWVFPAFRALASLRRLRGTPFDVFGYTLERRVERALPGDYEALVEQLLARLDAATLAGACALAATPDAIRGYGHVKMRNLVRAKQREWALARGMGFDAPASPIVRRAVEQAEQPPAAPVSVAVQRPR
ncbi:MAG: indolepyruvate ferredoxin oxidoreductase family protein [Burkholderiaceae bacterium]|nr:indolepyruvate ferredoxin oxidoreductase family protein [Burkholderiaceae bacterium]